MLRTLGHSAGQEQLLCLLLSSHLERACTWQQQRSIQHSTQQLSTGSTDDSTQAARHQTFSQQQQQHVADTVAAGLAAHSKQPAAVAGRRYQAAQVSSEGFATVLGHDTASGYKETKLLGTDAPPGSGAAADASQQAQLPSEGLRIKLRHEELHVEAQEQLDAYSISRSLIGGDGPGSFTEAVAAADSQQQQQHPLQQSQLTAADKETLEKLVGVMTKDGKKSRARRVLLDAMHIIKQQLAKGQRDA